MIDKIAEYLVPIYSLVLDKNSDLRKTLLVESFGRFVTFNTTEDFLNVQQSKGVDISKLEKKVDPNNNIVVKGIETTTNFFSNKKFKNMVAKLLHDNPNVEHVLKEYTNMLDFEGITEKQIDNRIDLVKNISSIGKLLKADPYNEPQFSKEVLNYIIKVGFDGLKEDRGLDDRISLLRKAFNNGVDKSLIRDLISQDVNKSKEAKEIVEMVVLSDKTKENKSLVLTTVASFAGLSYATMQISNPEAIKEMMEGVKQGLSFAPEIANNLISTLNSTPIGHVLLSSALLYVATKAIGEGYKKFVEHLKENQIRTTKPEEHQYESTNALLTNNIIGGVILNSFYDLTDTRSKDYLIMSSFLVEKIKNPTFQVSVDLKTDLRLSDNEVNKLNSLTREAIHELFIVNDPAIRKHLLLNDVSEKDKVILKKIALMKDFTSADSNYDGKIIKDISSIQNIPPTLQSKINLLPKNEQFILESYLNIHRTKEDKISPKKLEFIESNLSRNSVYDIVDSELIKFKENVASKHSEEEKKNLLVSYLSKVIKIPGSMWDHFIARTGEAEKIKGVNYKVKEELEKINQKYGFVEAQNVTEKYKHVVYSTKKVQENIMDKISTIRSYALRTSSSTTLTP